MPDDKADPGSGMRITFNNLVYDVKNKQNKRQTLTILHGLSGFFNPAQMTAVMGPRYSYMANQLEFYVWHSKVLPCLFVCSQPISAAPLNPTELCSVSTKNSI